MPPAFYPRYIGESQTATLAMQFGKSLTGENDAGRAVGDLATVEFTYPTFDGGVECGVVTKTPLGEGPVPCLRPGVLFGVTKVNLGDACQGLVSDPVAVVILLSDAIKQERPGEFAALSLMPLPGRSTQILGPGSSVDIAHELQSDHAGHVIVAGLNVAHSRQHGH